jgi:hypothetical protein
LATARGTIQDSTMAGRSLVSASERFLATEQKRRFKVEYRRRMMAFGRDLNEQILWARFTHPAYVATSGFRVSGLEQPSFPRCSQCTNPVKSRQKARQNVVLSEND